MGYGDLSNLEWGLTGPVLMPDRRRWARPADYDRCFLNSMLHVLKVGCRWATCASASASGTRPLFGVGTGPHGVSGVALLHTLVSLGSADEL